MLRGKLPSLKDKLGINPVVSKAYKSEAKKVKKDEKAKVGKKESKKKK